MVHTVSNHGAVAEVSSLRDEYVRAYRIMLLARVLDDKFASLYRMGKIHGGVFLGRGQEALQRFHFSQQSQYSVLVGTAAGGTIHPSCQRCGPLQKPPRAPQSTPPLPASSNLTAELRTDNTPDGT